MSVCLGCYDKVFTVGRVAYVQQKLTSFSSGGWKSKIGVSAQSAAIEGPLPGCKWHLLLLPSCVRKEVRNTPSVSLVRV